MSTPVDMLGVVGQNRRVMADTTDTTEQLTEDSPCPSCGECGIWRESADVGIGVIYGPFGCPCGWSEYHAFDQASGPPEAPDGWRTTPQGMLVNVEREREEIVAAMSSIRERFGIRLAPAFLAFSARVNTGLGKRAPVRKRRKRLVKKIDGRGGYASPTSLGGFIAREDLAETLLQTEVQS